MNYSDVINKKFSHFASQINVEIIFLIFLNRNLNKILQFQSLFESLEKKVADDTFIVLYTYERILTVRCKVNVSLLRVWSDPAAQYHFNNGIVIIIIISIITIILFVSFSKARLKLLQAHTFTFAEISVFDVFSSCSMIGIFFPSLSFSLTWWSFLRNAWFIYYRSNLENAD